MSYEVANGLKSRYVIILNGLQNTGGAYDMNNNDSNLSQLCGTSQCRLLKSY